MLNRAIVVIVTLAVTNFRTCLTEPLGTNNKWQRTGIIPQDYNGYLSRGIDSIRHAVSRTEISIQTLQNRLDLIETRLQTVQSSFQHTLEAVSTAVKSSEMKYELLLEQLSRKMEAGFDRLTHRINTMESRSEGMINKLQNQMDFNFERLYNTQNGIGNDLIRINSNIDAIKIHGSKQEDINNQTFQIIINHLQEIHFEHGVKQEHLKNITSLLDNLNNNRTEILPQNDAPTLPEEGLKIIRSEISDEGHKIGAKMHNMYNDLWRTVKDLEVMIKRGFDETNSTSRELYTRLSEMLIDEQRNSESFMDVVMRSVLTSVGDILSDLQRQVDIRFKEFKTSQEKQTEFCNKTKNDMENRVAMILEKIYDRFINRTDKVSKSVVELTELLKAHNKQLTQSTNESRRLLVTLAEENSQDHKQLDNSITDISESCQDLQIQAQEINDLLLRDEGSIREIKGLLLAIKEKQNIINSSKSIQNENLHAIKANFSDGVINIKTSLPNKTPNTTILQKEINHQSGIPLEALNKSVSTKELEAIIGESRVSGGKPDEDPDGERKDTEREGNDENDFEDEEETGEGKPVDLVQLLHAYIKLLQGDLSTNEFLAEAVPGNSYANFDDMIKHLRRAGNVPRETIHNIEQQAQEQQEKESLQTEADISRIIKKLQQNQDSDIDEDENYDDEDLS